MTQFIPQAAIILVSAVAEDLLRVMDKVPTLQATTLHCKVIANLGELRSQQTDSDNTPPTPFPCMFRPGPSQHPQPPTTKSTAVQRTIKSHSSSVYALFSDWKESLWKDINYFAMFLINSIHAFSHTNKTEFLRWTSKLVRNNTRWILFSKLSCF